MLLFKTFCVFSYGWPPDGGLRLGLGKGLGRPGYKAFSCSPAAAAAALSSGDGRGVLCLEIFLDILCVYMSYLSCMVPFSLVLLTHERWGYITPHFLTPQG